MFTAHALEQMENRGILQSDAEAVMKAPDKSEPGRSGATNHWGYGPTSGFRIRVTVAADGDVKTVAWADYRKKEKPQ